MKLDTFHSDLKTQKQFNESSLEGFVCFLNACHIIHKESVTGFTGFTGDIDLTGGNTSSSNNRSTRSSLRHSMNSIQDIDPSDNNNNTNTRNTRSTRSQSLGNTNTRNNNRHSYGNNNDTDPTEIDEEEGDKDVYCTYPVEEDAVDKVTIFKGNLKRLRPGVFLMHIYIHK